MTPNLPEPVLPGNPQSAEHDAWLLALGRATLAAAHVAGIAFDLLRILGDHESAGLYSDPLGRLESKLDNLDADAPTPGLAAFLALLSPARDTRNDLLHALPVYNGLRRRRTDDPHYVRDFFTVESLDAVTRELDEAAMHGTFALYHDDGKSVDEWYRLGKYRG